MQLDQIHIDLETLGTGDRAKILSIGAVCGTEEFYCEIDQLGYPEQLPFEVDQDTLEWWDKRGGFQPTCEPVTPSMAMASFSTWYNRVLADVVPIDEPEVWANPPKFDCNKINHHLNVFGMAPLWGWWQERCVRTQKKQAAKLRLNVPEFKNPHHALQDAKNQQKYIDSVMLTLAQQVQLANDRADDRALNLTDPE